MDGEVASALHASPDAELRLATVLKCDLVESTRLLGALDPSDRLAASRAIRKLIDDIAQRFSGAVERWDGDGATVLFGCPLAREDAPECAVNAALALAAAIRAIQVGGNKPDFRVGVATGPVAVDLTRGSFDGPAFNIAERLRAAGEPGWVVIADSTRRLTRNYFEYDDLGLVVAKGFDGGLQAWRALGTTTVTSRFEAQRPDRAYDGLVGRDDERELLLAAWRRARCGNGQVAFVVGEAGIGKSRLASEVLDGASAEGAMRLEVHCTPSTRNSPLFPVGVLLRRAAAIGSATPDADKPALARQLLTDILGAAESEPALNHLAPLFGLEPAAPPRAEVPEYVQEAMVITVVGMLRAMARRGPMTLLCEDLQWADDTSVKVIQRFIGEIAELPALVLLTMRSGADAVRDSATFGAIDPQITLSRLPAADAGELVRRLAGPAQLPDFLVNNIIERCEGVPLIIAEVTRGLMESETLELGDDVRDAVASDVPVPLQLVIESRLERWQQDKPLLHAASALGREFPIPVLATLIGGDSAEVSADVDRLAEGGWFVRRGSTGNDHARFTHAMIRDGVYQTLLRDDRRRLHARIADALITLHLDSIDAAPDLLAQHLCEATRFAEAIEVRLAAAADTVARGAYVESEGHCEAALKIVENVADPAARRDFAFRLNVQLGVVLTGRYGFAAPQTETVYRRAREACGESSEAATLYPILRGLTALNVVRGNLAAAYDLSLQNMSVAKQSHVAAFEIDALSVHCYSVLYYRGLPECREWIEGCVELYTREDGTKLTYPVPNDAKTAALAVLPTVEWLLGNSHAAEEAVLSGLAHVELIDRAFDRANMHSWIAGLRYTQRRFPECLRHARLAITISEEHGIREWKMVSRGIELIAAAAIAPSPAALQEAIDHCLMLAGEGVGANASWYLWGIAHCYRVLGDATMSGQMIDMALARAAADGETRMNAELLIAKAGLEADCAISARLLSEALAVSDRLGDVANALRAAAALVRLNGGNSALVELACDTHELLDGRRAYPAERSWMRDRLERLRLERAAA